MKRVRHKSKIRYISIVHQVNLFSFAAHSETVPLQLTPPLNPHPLSPLHPALLTQTLSVSESGTSMSLQASTTRPRSMEFIVTLTWPMWSCLEKRSKSKTWKTSVLAPISAQDTWQAQQPLYYWSVQTTCNMYFYVLPQCTNYVPLSITGMYKLCITMYYMNVQIMNYQALLECTNTAVVRDQES